MGKNIQLEEGSFTEGYFFCRWLHSRLIKNNKNVLGVELGPTGSGKSWRDLRKAELWYKYHFKEKFPVENICFGVLQVMQLISSGKLRRGDVIIFEEAGANLGSLDFQNKISKMFTYVLQSFRSMNVAIFFNLPYFSMLNKSARMLMHYKSESAGIIVDKKVNRCKFFLHQVNQSSGKIYPKYAKISYDGKIRKIKKFAYHMPSKYLIDAYEDKKAAYLRESTEEYTKLIQEIQDKDRPGPELPPLKPYQLSTYNDNQDDLTESESAKKQGVSQNAIHKRLMTIKKLGYPIKRQNISKNPSE